MRLLADPDEKDGINYGSVKESQFERPAGIHAKFESVVYVGEPQTNSIKICSELNECVNFLKAIGCLYDAFSVHNKGHIILKTQQKKLWPLLRNEERYLTRIHAYKRLNGLQRHVSARIVASDPMIDTGLQRLYANLRKFENLLSCMTLDLEICHSTIHVKQSNISMAEYCRLFGLEIKEVVTRMTTWAAYCHINRQFWYPKPEGALWLS